MRHWLTSPSCVVMRIKNLFYKWMLDLSAGNNTNKQKESQWDNKTNNFQPSRLVLRVSVETWIQEPVTHEYSHNPSDGTFPAVSSCFGFMPQYSVSPLTFGSQPGRSHILYLFWVVSTVFIYCNTLCWALVFISFLLCHCTSFPSNQGFPNGS